jgi:hypothetical protein
MPSPANTTNNTYCLSTNLTGQADAEDYCNTLGGHLASWNSQAEQTEVEGYWIKAGLLLPLFHKAYWIGAVIGDEDMWPNFRWLVGGCWLAQRQVVGWAAAGPSRCCQLPTTQHLNTATSVQPAQDNTPGINSTSYTHWGIPRGRTKEPNDPETTAAVCDAGLAYQKLWGWADVDSATYSAVAMCEVQREWSGQAAGCRLRLLPDCTTAVCGWLGRSPACKHAA